MGGVLVGLCRDLNCNDCRVALGSSFAGGDLEVIIPTDQMDDKERRFYIAHLIRQINADGAISSGSSALPAPREDFANENDADGVTSFVYEAENGEAIMVDCGASPAMKPGSASPIIEGLFKRHNIKNVCFTHAHLDHISHAHLVGDRTAHMTPLASRYIQRELDRQGRGRVRFEERLFVPKNTRFSDTDYMSIGPFMVVPILVPHSISESCMFLIVNEKSGRTALHQGDAKMQGMDWQEALLMRDRYAQIGEFGVVDVMHVDTLNCHRHGSTPEESEVCKSLGNIVETTKGRIVIGVFATNLRRIKAVEAVAMKLNREVEFVGASMRFAKELLEDEGGKYPHRGTRNPVVFTSGCQGEPDSVLWREAEGTDSPLGLGKGDTVIFSSHKIPGNEKRIAAVVQKLVAKGCRVIVNKGEVRSLRLDPEKVEEAFTHVSGHGQQADVEAALDLVKPRAVIPSITRRGSPQVKAFQEICATRGIQILNPTDNCFVL